MTPSPPNIPHTGGDRYARQTTPMPVYSPPGKNEDLISAPWLRLYIPPPAGEQHYRTRFCMPGHDIPPDRGGIPRAVQPEGRGRTYSLRPQGNRHHGRKLGVFQQIFPTPGGTAAGEMRHATPTCMPHPHGGNLEKSRVRPERAMPGLYPGLCPAFSGRSAAGNGRRAFSAPQPWGGVICCFFTEQSMFFSGRHAFTPWHGASGRKRTMLNEKALTIFTVRA